MQQFNIHADAYNAVRKKITYPESLYQWIQSQCSGFESALDIGCGNGVSTVRLRGYFEHLEGSDLGENLIEKARANYPEIPFTAVPAEKFETNRQFDLVTSATSFYWMNRELVLQRMADYLKSDGVFCAYKYDFPIVYGPLRNFIESELANKWSKYRDVRLTQYDDTLEKIIASGTFEHAERKIISNIITLSPMEVGLFFLSTSYVTAYQDQEGGAAYRDTFLKHVIRIAGDEPVKVNFDVQAFLGQRKK